MQEVVEKLAVTGFRDDTAAEFLDMAQLSAAGSDSSMTLREVISQVLADGSVTYRGITDRINALRLCCGAMECWCLRHK